MYTGCVSLVIHMALNGWVAVIPADTHGTERVNTLSLPKQNTPPPKKKAELFLNRLISYKLHTRRK